MLDSSLTTKTSTTGKTAVEKVQVEPLCHTERSSTVASLPSPSPLRRMCLSWYSYTTSVCFAGWFHVLPPLSQGEGSREPCTALHPTHANQGTGRCLLSRNVFAQYWSPSSALFSHKNLSSWLAWRATEAWLKAQQSPCWAEIPAPEVQPCTAMMSCLCPPVWDSGFFTQFNC